MTQRVQYLGIKKDAAPSEKDGAKTYTFVASDGESDRYQDRIAPDGWKLDAYNANPVILFGHDDYKNLPIGTGRAYLEGERLLVDITFDQEDEFATRVEKKVAKGQLNCVSVRYLMLDYAMNSQRGFDCKSQELLEISVVSVPGNSRAVRLREAPGADADAKIAALEAQVAALIAAQTPAPAETPAPEEKSAPEFDAASFTDALVASIRKHLKG